MFKAVSVGGSKSAAETTYELDNENFKAEIGDELYDQLVEMCIRDSLYISPKKAALKQVH